MANPSEGEFSKDPDLRPLSVFGDWPLSVILLGFVLYLRLFCKETNIVFRVVEKNGILALALKTTFRECVRLEQLSSSLTGMVRLIDISINKFVRGEGSGCQHMPGRRSPSAPPEPRTGSPSGHTHVTVSVWPVSRRHGGTPLIGTCPRLRTIGAFVKDFQPPPGGGTL